MRMRWLLDKILFWINSRNQEAIMRKTYGVKNIRVVTDAAMRAYTHEYVNDKPRQENAGFIRQRDPRTPLWFPETSPDRTPKQINHTEN